MFKMSHLASSGRSKQSVNTVIRITCHNQFIYPTVLSVLRNHNSILYLDSIASDAHVFGGNFNTIHLVWFEIYYFHKLRRANKSSHTCPCFIHPCYNQFSTQTPNMQPKERRSTYAQGYPRPITTIVYSQFCASQRFLKPLSSRGEFFCQQVVKKTHPITSLV
jgi:hypothetical protein